MTSHIESRELSVYALVSARNGPKMRPTAADTSQTDVQLANVKPGEGKDGFPEVNLRSPGIVIETKDGRARITAHEVSLARFADFLSNRLDRPVLDQTGLTGIYNLALYYRPDGIEAGDSSEASIFVALQEQLGLRLDARRGVVQMLVIDRAEKIPVEN
jgi:uncharacterized protein (TIGR03435 family)